MHFLHERPVRCTSVVVKAQTAAIDFVLKSVVEIIPSSVESLQKAKKLIKKYSDLLLLKGGEKVKSTMKWEQIKRKFSREWVLIECVKVDDDTFQVLEGKVLCHDYDKDKIYKSLLELRPKKYTIEYIGEVPEDLAVML